MLFKTTDYETFLDKLNQITNIDIRILDNLKKLGLLQFIFENKNSIYSNHELYIIENPILIEHYQSTTEYLFASFPLYNPEYKINEKNYELSSIYNNYKPKILLVSEYSSIQCYHYISLSRFSKYPIKDLNNNEKEMLKNEIKKIFNKYGYLGLFSSSNNKQDLISNPNYLPENYFFRYDYDTLENHHQLLSNFISECIINYQIIEKKIINTDFPLYERLILSKKIKDF